ncbi:MAG: 30S ribosomal protein S16 [Saprospiraceae bacterium]
MAVKLRLQRKGRKAAPFYHIVAADSRSPRDGKFIEKIGTYNPLTVPASIELDRERAAHWINVGAQPTDTVNAILRFKGVLYAKHLQKGVAKGAFDQAKADEMLAKWIEEKENRIEQRREETKEAKKKFVAKVDGTAKVKVKPVPVVPAEEEKVAEAVEAEAGAEEMVAEAVEAGAGAEEMVAEAVEAEAEEAAPAEEAVAEEAAPAEEAVEEEAAPAEEEKTEE